MYRSSRKLLLRTKSDSKEESRRVITNLNSRDIERILSKRDSTTKVGSHNEVKAKAKALLRATVEDSKGAKLFFSNTIEYSEGSFPLKRLSGEVLIKAHLLHEDAIINRIKRKRTEDETLPKSKDNPSFSLPENSESGASFEESERPVKRPPKRKGPAQNLSHLLGAN